LAHAYGKSKFGLGHVATCSGIHKTGVRLLSNFPRLILVNNHRAALSNPQAFRFAPEVKSAF
jgi:hypothetical protein